MTNEASKSDDINCTQISDLPLLDKGHQISNKAKWICAAASQGLEWLIKPVTTAVWFGFLQCRWMFQFV